MNRLELAEPIRHGKSSSAPMSGRLPVVSACADGVVSESFLDRMRA